MLTHKGVTKSLPEWARHFDIPKVTAMSRYRRGGFSFEEIFSKTMLPKRGRKSSKKIKPNKDNLKRAAERKAKPGFEALTFDPDLKLKREIEYWRSQGLDDDEILIKLRYAA